MELQNRPEQIIANRKGLIAGSSELSPIGKYYENSNTLTLGSQAAITSVELPAGKYVAFGYINSNGNTITDVYECWLSISRSATFNRFISNKIASQTNSTFFISVGGIIDLDSPDTLYLVGYLSIPTICYGRISVVRII